MTEWRSYAMADVMAEFYDGPHATPPAASSGPVYLGIKNITESGSLDLSDPKYIAESDFGKWTKRVTPGAGDVVFVYEATLHRYALIPEGFRGCLGRRIALIRPDLRIVNPRFLHLVMLGPRWRATVTDRIISGSTVDRIPIIDFPKFPIELPDLETQERIVGVLGAIDDLIENNRRRVELLEQMAQAIYREWFVHFRYPGHEHDELVDSLLGPIPGGWQASTLGEVMELRYGKALKAEHRKPGSVAVVGSAGVVGCHDAHLVAGPAIVVGRKGNIGRVIWLDRDCFPIDTTYFVVTELPLRFAYRQLLGVEFINSHAAVPGLSREQAYGAGWVDPSEDLVRRYSDLADDLGAESLALSDSAARLVAIRDLLLPKMVTGQIDVSRLDLDVVLEGAGV